MWSTAASESRRTLPDMAPEDEHRLYTLLTMVGFGNETHVAELREVVPKPRYAALKEAVIDYRSGDGKPRQYR